MLVGVEWDCEEEGSTHAPAGTKKSFPWIMGPSAVRNSANAQMARTALRNCRCEIDFFAIKVIPVCTAIDKTQSPELKSPIWISHP